MQSGKKISPVDITKKTNLWVYYGIPMKIHWHVNNVHYFGSNSNSEKIFHWFSAHSNKIFDTLIHFSLGEKTG